MTLQPNDSCTVSVDFTAAEPKAYTGQINFPSTSPHGTQYVGLKGTGVAALINQSSNFVFSNTVVGATSAAKTVTMSNLNASPVTLTVTGIELLNSCGVNISADNCTGTVLQPKSASPANTCSVLLTFTPTAQGLCNSTTLKVNSSGGNSPSIISMQGTGTLAAPTYAPKPLAFGKETVGGTTGALTVTATNSNPVAMQFTSASINLADYQIVGDTCSGNLIPGSGDTCTFSITFTPSTTGAITGTLSIIDGGGTGTQSVTLTGTGK